MQLPADRLYELQRTELLKWYRLTFVYGALVLMLLGTLLLFAWGCRG